MIFFSTMFVRRRKWLYLKDKEINTAENENMELRKVELTKNRACDFTLSRHLANNFDLALSAHLAKSEALMLLKV